MMRVSQRRVSRFPSAFTSGKRVPAKQKLWSVALLASASAATLGVSVASAANLSWSADGQTPSSGGGGLWNTNDLRWWNLGNYHAWNNGADDTAVFAGDAGSIFANASIAFGGLGFTTDMFLGAFSGNTYTWGGTALTLDVASGATATVFPSIAANGAQTLTKTGDGTFRFFNNIGSNVGTINLTAGTLAFAGASADLSNPTHLEISSGATFDLGLVNDTFGSIAGSGSIRLGTFQGLGVVTGPLLNVGTNNLSTTFSGNIIGSGGRFTKSGTGNLTLSGNNTFAGIVSIAGGTLTLAGGNAMSDNAFVGLTAAAAGQPIVTLALQSSEVIGSLGSNAGVAGTIPTVNLNSFDLSVGADNFPSAQFNGMIEGSGRLVKVGSGIQQLTTAGNLSTWTGGTVIRDGILVASADRKLGAVPASPTLNITLDGGTLAGFSTVGYVLDANRSIEITANNGGILVPQDGTATRTISYGGTISGPGALTKTGSGNLAFVEQAGFPLQSNTYTGGTVLREGTLTSGLATTASAGTPLGTGNVDMSYSTLQFLPTPVGGNISLTTATDSGRTFTYGPGSNLTIGRNTNNSIEMRVGPGGAVSSSLVRAPDGTLVITPTNGISELGSAAGSGIRVIVHGGVANANGGVPAVHGDMVSGSIISTTSNTDFTGEFLKYTSDGLTRADYSTQADLNLTGANDVFDASANQALTANSRAYALNVRSGVSVSGPHLLNIGDGSGAAGVIFNGNNATVNVSTLAFGGAQGVLYAGGSAAGSESRLDSNISGTAGIAKVGNGNLILGHNGALSYTGPTNVSAGTLRLTSNNQLPASTTVTVGNTGTLDLNGTSQSVAAIDGRSAFTSGIALGNNGRLTVGAGDSTFLGVISGSGGNSALVKDGAGVLTLGYPTSSAAILSSTNTYNKLVVRNGGEVNFSRDQSLGAIPAANPNAELPGLQDQITLDGGTLRWTGLATATTTTGNSNALSNQRGIVVGPNGATIDVVHPLEILLYQRGNGETAADTRNLISSADPNNPGTITKKGQGFFRLGVGNQFAGKWVIQEGNLQFQTDRSLGVEPAVFTPDAITLDGGMIQSNGTGSLSPNRGITVTANGGQIQAFTFNAPFTGPGAIQKVGANTSFFNASSPTWTGGVTFSNGTMVFNANDAAGTGTIHFDDSNFVKAMVKTVAADVTLGNPIHLTPGGIAAVRVANGTLNLSGPISGSADLSKGVATASPGTLVLSSNASSFTGKVIVNEGAVVVTGTHALGDAAGATIVNPGATLAFENVGSYAHPERVYIGGAGNTGLGALQNLGGDNVMPGPVIASQDAMIGIQSGTLTVGPVRGASVVTKNGPGTLAAQHYRVNTLNIDQAAVRVTQRPTAGDINGTSRVKELNLAGGASPTATLDITNNAFVIDYDGASPMPTVRAQITNAYNGGAWDQAGITSSLANNSQFGVGYGEASSLSSVPAAFGTVDSTAVLFRYTRYGDADLNGVVNLADFNRLAANFGSSNADWTQGDFTYDGLVNLADFNRLAGNFGLQAGPDGPTPDDWSNLASAVPEPAGMSVLVSGLAMLLGRRRRRTRA